MEEVVLSKGNRTVRVLLALFSWLFFICIIIQVFLAGLAIFVSQGQWADHELFVRFFAFLPIIMLILSLLGKTTKGYKWQCFGLFLMIILQYMTAGLSSNLPYISALHPILALILFWRALVTAKESTTMLKK
ncbi:DUF6220 domain-containing protein [Pullulanibacillus sp. KACC 23026]|uniref:DUF6220 domain-containing protein n=1 Tax=Pullulanibacillus sp. KACC 23026 TaxID=3028315 RepID=UPI0023B03127|nr:DUF6220 domain-containing protein [Pullulanibacillus sp. KACC 23026]WEG14560.1 DUF6220 domain-containing protein [Pullulanibacillus sp. KACC 23026]